MSLLNLLRILAPHVGSNYVSICSEGGAIYRQDQVQNMWSPININQLKPKLTSSELLVSLLRYLTIERCLYFSIPTHKSQIFESGAYYWALMAFNSFSMHIKQLTNFRLD